MRGFQPLLAVLLTLVSTSTAHLFLKYPGTRGDNLWSNLNYTKCVKGTIDDYNGKAGCFPYGMQWMYPCGGLPHRGPKNRTYWPLTGGAVSFQPGWQTGHQTAFIYINLGIGTVPPNMSHPMVPVFQIVSPTNNPYPDKEVCIPQVGIPANLSLQDGQHATIQVVEAAKHGAALYSCVDVTLTSNLSLVERVTEKNCRNSSSMSFNLVYGTAPLHSGGMPSITSPNAIGIMSLAFVVILGSSLL